MGAEPGRAGEIVCVADTGQRACPHRGRRMVGVPRRAAGNPAYAVPRLAWAVRAGGDYSEPLTRGFPITDCLPTACLCLFGLLAGASAQSVPVARQVAPGLHDVLVAAPGAPAQTMLSGVEFLPLDLAGFAVRDRLSSTRAVPVDGPLAPHVRCSEGGSLYLVHGGGATSLLHVRADGSAAVAFTRPDAGGPAIAGRAHRALDAPLVLLATTPAAGGQVWLVNLDGAPPRLLSAPGSPAADPLSLRVSAGRAFFVAGGTLQAARLALPGPAAPVPLGAPGDTTLGEIALSDDGLSVAAVSQAPGGLRLVHVVDEALQAHQITPLPGVFDTPNYGSPFGPWLVLSPDGSQVAWRATIAASTEVFVEDVPQPAPPLQITADGNFIDTIDGVGVLGFSAAGKLHFMAGEKQLGGVPGQLGGADLFLVLPGAGGSIALSNVTGTSGDTVAPFTAKGELEVVDAVLDPAGANLLLTVDPHGGDAALMSVPADVPTGGTMLLPSLSAAPELHAAGDDVLVLSQTCTTCDQALHRLSTSGAFDLLALLPAALTVDRFTDGGGRAAFVVSASPGQALAARLDLGTGTFDLPWPFAGAVSAGLALAGPAGDLVLGVGDAGGPQLLLQLDGLLSGHVVKVPIGTLVPLDL